MNLNPLKKDDNTDALVKALEDANSSDSGASAPDASLPQTDTGLPPATPGFDPTATASDPAGATLPPTDSTDAPALTLPDIAPADTPGTTPEATTTEPSNDVPADAPATDPTAGLTFDGNDLPSGLSTDADATPAAGPSGEVDDVKRSALEQLRPLIEKLDLEPADKFDKYLMMLRASDDPALIKPAFDAAQGITGEKEKAQALLDIINEINYITANQQQS